MSDPPPPLELASTGDRVYFTADKVETGWSLWTSDGTIEGTRVTDGTTDGTVLVMDIAPGSASSDPELLTPLGDRLYFYAASS